VITSERPQPVTTTISDASRLLLDVGVDAMERGVDLVGELMTTMARIVPRRTCGCEIPIPCWMPLPLGRVVSHVCPGGRAIVKLEVINCGATRRSIAVEATSAGISITGSPLDLGPMAEGTITASIDVPVDARAGDDQDTMLWVRGCRDHFLRWAIRVRSRGVDSCHQVEVKDCPDLVHRWSDHFYCEHPCSHSVSQ